MSRSECKILIKLTNGMVWINQKDVKLRKKSKYDTKKKVKSYKLWLRWDRCGPPVFSQCERWRRRIGGHYTVCFKKYYTTLIIITKIQRFLYTKKVSKIRIENCFKRYFPLKNVGLK